MADISMCLGEGCPKKKQCHRYTAHPNPYAQSYSDFDKRCPNNNYQDFWDNTGMGDIISIKRS